MKSFQKELESLYSENVFYTDKEKALNDWKKDIFEVCM